MTTIERPRTGLAVLALAAVLLLVSLDQTVVGTAMPTVVAELQGFSLYGWVTTAYLLAEMVAIPVFGKLGDRLGRRRLVVVGVAVFLVGSWLSGLAWSMAALVAFRGLQGLGAGIVLATLFALLADIFPNAGERARFQGIFGAVFSISSLIGPWIGGLITDYADWRWVFFVNVPVGIAALALLPVGLRGIVQPPVRRLPIDWAGAVTVAGASVGLLLGLTWVGEGDAWTSTRVLVALVAGVAFLAAFVVAERRAVDPILPGSLFTDRSLLGLLLTVTALGFGMFAAILYAPLFVQGVLGAGATSSGTVLLPLVLTMTVTGMVAGWLTARTNRIKPFLVTGTLLLTAALLLLSTLGTGSSVLQVGLYLFVVGLGMGLLMTVTTTGVQAIAPSELLGVATSATQFLRTLGGTVGTAVLASIVAASYTAGYRAPTGTPDALANSLADPDVVSNATALAELDPAGASPSVVDAAVAAAREALAGGVQTAFLVAAGVSLVAVVGALLVRDVPLQQPEPVPAPDASTPNVPAPVRRREGSGAGGPDRSGRLHSGRIRRSRRVRGGRLRQGPARPAVGVVVDALPDDLSTADAASG